jgi:hypothetical protein
MGFYLRKSLSVGPFRFNLSGSGIGVSTGIKGFRVGTGPRGNYIHMGRGGLYFRASLPSGGGHAAPRPVEPADTPQPQGTELEEIESGSTLQMVDSSSAALLEEINSKSRKMRLWPVALLASIAALGGLAVLQAPIWVYCVVAPLCCGGVYAASLRDRLQKTVVLFYEIEPRFEEAYQALHNVFDRMRCCNGAWHIEARGDIQTLYEWKTHAGASSIVRRRAVAFRQGAPPYFKTNVLVPVVPAGRQTLYFFPDRLLVYAPEGIGAVLYAALEVDWSESRFIEVNSVPSDARVVDRTWRYVNKSGGPDRRFNDNPELPIALYEAVQFRSLSGLKELFQLSRTGIGQELERATKSLADVLSQQMAAGASEFLTCPCNNCSGHIEFPADGVGQTVPCPHCGLDTVLFRPAVAGAVNREGSEPLRPGEF